MINTIFQGSNYSLHKSIIINFSLSNVCMEGKRDEFIKLKKNYAYSYCKLTRKLSQAYKA